MKLKLNHCESCKLTFQKQSWWIFLSQLEDVTLTKRLLLSLHIHINKSTCCNNLSLLIYCKIFYQPLFDVYESNNTPHYPQHKKRSPETIMTFICLLWLFYKNNALCISEKEFKGKPRVSDRAGREHVACLRSHCIWSIDPIDSTEDDEAIYRDAYL